MQIEFSLGKMRILIDMIDSIGVEGFVIPVYHLGPHLAHAAQAYYTSPFPNAVAITFDGGGDGAFLLSAKGEGGKLLYLAYNDGFVQPDRPSI